MTNAVTTTAHLKNWLNAFVVGQRTPAPIATPRMFELVDLSAPEWVDSQVMSEEEVTDPHGPVVQRILADIVRRHESMQVARSSV